MVSANSGQDDVAGPAALELVQPRPLLRENGLLYQQLASILREPIQNGVFPLGSALPTESSLAERFAVSLITVRQALRQLEQEGYIKKRAAKSAVVTAPLPRIGPSWDLNRFADIAANAQDGRLEIKSYRKECAEIAAEVFGLRPRTPCWCLRGVLINKGEPAAQITIYFPPAIGSRLTLADFDDVVVFRSVQRRLGVKLAGARCTLSSEVADTDLAADLDCEEGTPVLVMRLVYRDLDQRPVELTLAKHRGDRFSITYDLPNEGT